MTSRGVAMRRLLSGLGLLLVLALVATACGGDDDADEAAQSVLEAFGR